MNLVTIIVTRSKACHVKTLHTILRMNVQCLQKKLDNQIVFVNDDPFEKAETIQRFIKDHERIVCIEFGVGLDDGSIAQCFEKHDGVGCVVFPGVREGIDWNLFREKVNKGSSEPTNQMGLHFDTDVGKKVAENMYHVVSTDAKAWIMNTKVVLKTMQKEKNKKIYPKMFEKFKENGLRMYAFTAAKLNMTFTHECISNIQNAAGVKVR